MAGHGERTEWGSVGKTVSDGSRENERKWNIRNEGHDVEETDEESKRAISNQREKPNEPASSTRNDNVGPDASGKQRGSQKGTGGKKNEGNSTGTRRNKFWDLEAN